MKILFFIGSLRSGGKERRLVELLSYLKDKGGYEMKLVLNYNDIAYQKFNTLGIDVIELAKKKNNKDLSIFAKFYRICKEFKPDIIHTWGGMQSFYALSSKILLNIPLVNSQIADVMGVERTSKFSNFINWVNFRFSNVICSNSYAGLKAYKQDKDKRAVVVYNGLDENRFIGLISKDDIRQKYGIFTLYAVVMTATYYKVKDWQRFVNIAIEIVGRRNDITFIGVGAIADEKMYNELSEQVREYDNIKLQGRCNEVENLVNACDVGVLFSTQGEGVSNTILEYLALGKAVVVDRDGGTSEFVIEGYNGFFANDKSIDEVADLIIKLIDDESLRLSLGANGKKTISKNFTLDKMGSDFEKVYHNLKK